MKLLIYSLGNPGPKYAHTRHNAGRIVCDNINFEMLNQELSSELNEELKGENISLEYKVPDTYMNETGKYILDDVKYMNLMPSNIVIVYDDIDIAFGEVKLSYDRSSGGHNGVESVINELGTREFYRIRIGIGEKLIKEMLLQDYVLSKLTNEEIEILKNKNMQNIIKEKIKDIIRMN